MPNLDPKPYECEYYPEDCKVRTASLTDPECHSYMRWKPRAEYEQNPDAYLPLDPKPWVNDYGYRFKNNDPIVDYKVLALSPRHWFRQNLEAYL